MNYVGKLVRFRNNTSQPKRVKHQQGSMLYLDGEFGPYHMSQVEIVEEPSVPGSNPGEDAHTSEAQAASTPDHGQEERALAAGVSADRRIECDNCGSDELRTVCFTKLAKTIRSLQSPQPSEAENPKT